MNGWAVTEHNTHHTSAPAPTPSFPTQLQNKKKKNVYDIYENKNVPAVEYERK